MITRGENKGRTITYHNVVRRWVKLGAWNATANRWTVPLRDLAGDGDRERGGAGADRHAGDAEHHARRGDGADPVNQNWKPKVSAVAPFSSYRRGLMTSASGCDT